MCRLRMFSQSMHVLLIAALSLNEWIKKAKIRINDAIKCLWFYLHRWKFFLARRARPRYVGIRIPYIAGTRPDTLFASPGVIAAMRQIARLVGRILVYSCVDERTSRETCQAIFSKMLRDPLDSMGRSRDMWASLIEKNCVAAGMKQCFLWSCDTEGDRPFFRRACLHNNHC